MRRSWAVFGRCARPYWGGALVCLLGIFVRAQQPAVVESQSPRQAALEMLAGDEAAFKKHLTIEMQAKLDALTKNSSAATSNPLQMVWDAKAAGAASMEKFNSGPILVSFNNASEHERLEIHVDGDELRSEGQEDIMLLSLHLLRQGEEEDLAFGLRFFLSWKQQLGIWRLNELTVSAHVPIGDPRVLDKSWWAAPPVGPLTLIAAAPAATVSRVSPSTAPVDGHSKMSVVRSLRLIGLAENIYADKHPESGFTCSISDLVEIGKGIQDGEPFKFMDPEFAGGVYNGYKFVFSGCLGKPAKTFRIAAEPLSGAGRAYCSDPTHLLRAAEDGHAATCLASGKPVLH